MAERSSRRKREHDFAVTAFRVMQETTADPYAVPAAEEHPLDSEEKNPNAVAPGRLGGRKGGKARAEKLTPERRREIARKAAETRWATRKPSAKLTPERRREIAQKAAQSRWGPR